MRLIRTTMPTIAATAAVGALVAGVVVSTVEARHHKAPHKRTTFQGQAISAEMQQALAQKLDTMPLPKGVEHTKICPQTLTATDACFAGTLRVPVSSEVDAADAANKLLQSLQVVPGAAVACNPVLGGPQGSGYSCSGTGTWQTASLATTVFVSNPGHHLQGVPDIDLMLSVLSTKP